MYESIRHGRQLLYREPQRFILASCQRFQGIYRQVKDWPAVIGLDVTSLGYLHFARRYLLLFYISICPTVHMFNLGGATINFLRGFLILRVIELNGGDIRLRQRGLFAA